MFESISSINLQRKNTTAYKTTIPADISKILRISNKDKIKWTVSTENDKLKVCVEKVE